MAAQFRAVADVQGDWQYKLEGQYSQPGETHYQVIPDLQYLGTTWLPSRRPSWRGTAPRPFAGRCETGRPAITLEEKITTIYLTPSRWRRGRLTI